MSEALLSTAVRNKIHIKPKAFLGLNKNHGFMKFIVKNQFERLEYANSLKETQNLRWHMYRSQLILDEESTISDNLLTLTNSEECQLQSIADSPKKKPPPIEAENELETAFNILSVEDGVQNLPSKLRPKSFLGLNKEHPFMKFIIKNQFDRLKCANSVKEKRNSEHVEANVCSN